VKCCRFLVSHDTHVFRLAEPLNETLILDKLDYPINMWGAENGETTSYLLYCNKNEPVSIFKQLKFKIISPAGILIEIESIC